MFKTFFQSHISQLSCLLTSSFFKVYDSAPYRTVLQMTAFLILFFRQRLKAFDISSFFLVNVCNRRAQILFPSVLHDNSLVTWWSLVNMRAGVTIACGTILSSLFQRMFFLHHRARIRTTYHIYFLSIYFYYLAIVFWRPWHSNMEKNNLWPLLEVGLCLGGGSWLTQAQVWLKFESILFWGWFLKTLV